MKKLSVVALNRAVCLSPCSGVSIYKHNNNSPALLITWSSSSHRWAIFNSRNQFHTFSSVAVDHQKMSEAYFSEHLHVGEDQFSCVVGNGDFGSLQPSSPTSSSTNSKAILEFEKKKIHVRGMMMGEDEKKLNSFVVHEFYHIEIPDSCRGKGVAMPFAKACFDYAKQHGWKVKVTCPYLREKFLGQYREKYKDILYED